MKVRITSLILLAIIVLGVVLVAVSQGYQSSGTSEVQFRAESSVLDDQILIRYVPNSIGPSSYELRYYVVSQKNGVALEYQGSALMKDVSISRPITLWAMREENKSYEVYTLINDENGRALHYTLIIISDEPLSEQQWREAGRRFVELSPTYRFDGFDLRFAGAEKKGDKLILSYEFKSRHSGYGDRTGKILAEVITPHRAVLVIEDGELISAVMDEKWDMINQRFLR